MAGRLRFGRAGINREGKRKSEWERGLNLREWGLCRKKDEFMEQRDAWPRSSFKACNQQASATRYVIHPSPK